MSHNYSQPRKRKRKRKSTGVKLVPIRKRRKTQNTEEPFNAKDMLSSRRRYGKKREFQKSDQWEWKKFYPNLEKPKLRLNHWTLNSSDHIISPYSILNIKSHTLKYSDEEYKFIERILNLPPEEFKISIPKEKKESGVSQTSQQNLPVPSTETNPLEDKKSNEKEISPSKNNENQTKSVPSSKQPNIADSEKKPNPTESKSNGKVSVPKKPENQKLESKKDPKEEKVPSKVVPPPPPSKPLQKSSETEKIAPPPTVSKNEESVKPNSTQTKEIKPNPTQTNPNLSSLNRPNAFWGQLLGPNPTTPQPRLPPVHEIIRRTMGEPVNSVFGLLGNSPQNQQFSLLSTNLSAKNMQRRRSRRGGRYLENPNELQPPFEKWTKEETDELFKLCEEYDLRFPVIQDRLSFRKSLESIKERYLTLSQILLFIRSKGKLNKIVEHPYLMNAYNSSSERLRKKEVNDYYDRPSQMEERQHFLQKQLVGVQSRLKRKKLQIRQKKREGMEEREEDRKYIEEFAVLEKNRRLQKQFQNHQPKVIPGTIVPNHPTPSLFHNPLINSPQSLMIRSPSSVQSPPTPVLLRTVSFPPPPSQKNLVAPPPPPLRPFMNVNPNPTPRMAVPINPRPVSLLVNPVPKRVPTRLPEPIIIRHDSNKNKQGQKKKKKRRRRRSRKAIEEEDSRTFVTKFDRNVIDSLVGEETETPKTFVRSQLMRESVYGSPYTRNILNFLSERKCGISDLGIYSSRIHEEFVKLKDKVGEYFSKKKSRRRR